MQDWQDRPVGGRIVTWGNGVILKEGTSKTPADAIAIQRWNGVDQYAIRWSIPNQVWEQLANDYLTDISALL